MSKSPTDDAWWHRWLPASESVPVDAVAVVAVVVVANGVLFSSLAQIEALRALVGLPLLFLLPGYALVAGLFPASEPTEPSRLDWGVVGDGGAVLPNAGVDNRERLALSFGASVALLPIVAVGLSLAGFAYSLEVLTATISVVGVLGMAVGVVRRNRIPPRRRFQVPHEQWVATAYRGVFGRRSAVDAGLNVALAVVVVASLAGVGYAVVAPNDAESFTSVALLTENDEGTLTASGYPETLSESGEELVVRIENHEDEAASYAVVGELQRVRRSDGSVTVDRRGEVLRTSTTVQAGETWTNPHTVAPVVGGEDLRLVYYVYRGEAPAEPNTRTAYRYVDVTVDSPSGTSN